MASADIVKADCMKIYENERLRLHEMLDKIHSRVSLTADMWKSIADMDYVCLTCHYVDNDWRLQKKILNIFPLGPSELGQDVSKTIMEKLCAVLLDNCSTSEFVASELIGYLRAKGFLISNGDLLGSCECAICKIVTRMAICSSENAVQIGILEKPLVLDAPSNIYDAGNCMPLSRDFQTLGRKKVMWTMLAFSATKVPTANLYFNDMCGLHLLLKTWYKSPQPFVTCMAKEMLEKFEQYWYSTRMLMAIASVLDPRYKMKSVEYFFKQIYDDAFEAKTRIDNVRDCFINLYNEYVGHSANSSKLQAFCTGNNSGYSGSEYVNGGECKTSRITLSDTQRSEDNFDILAWWKYIASRYPVHSMMARDIMDIPISVVPLDSEARTLNQCLSSTDPAIIECLICSRDWIENETEVSPVYALAIVPSTAYLETNGDEYMLPAGCD
ncbi:hypothetical protein ZIOFF_051714 [Zingiber officinale]|uniref:Uncharacterized protein n=1 Tax=Zingiber officinale TaxID=94328 RepID=A0A8J5FN50_ZINOF|nr:hypothetical protein ZIOFF_051714 [Zingiber officinale]